MEPGFKAYQQQVVKNAQALAAGLVSGGFRVVSGGTDNHLFLVDLTVRNMLGRDAETALEHAGITVNKNAIPFDPNPPLKAGGIRVGSPAVTTRGMREPEMAQIAKWMAEVMANFSDAAIQARVRAEVASLAARFPMYPRRMASV